MIKEELSTNIKKALYREKPTATCIHQGGYTFQYWCYINTLPHCKKPYRVNFTVPVSDMGDATFGLQMPAQLLIRWIEL